MKRRACDAEERGGFGKDVRKENVTEVNGLLAVHGGAEKLFSFQRRGGQKGLRKEGSQVEDRLSLNLRDLLRYRERSVAPLHEEEEVTNILSRKTMLSWLSRLQMGFNLLIQGVGDPKPLMQRFAALLVNKEDVFELDCAASSRPIASLLDVIVRELLKRDPATIRAKPLSLVDYTEEVTRTSIAFMITYESLVHCPLNRSHQSALPTQRRHHESVYTPF